MSVRPASELGVAADLTPTPGNGKESRFPSPRNLCRVNRSTVLILFALAACKTASPTLPPAADLIAVTEDKPKPNAAILTDPSADARYNSAVEAWGDRIRAAGLRLCRFHERTGMHILACPTS
jgi:hypothetical protein